MVPTRRASLPTRHGPGEVRRLPTASALVGTPAIAGQLAQPQERWRTSAGASPSSPRRAFPPPGTLPGRIGSAGAAKPHLLPARNMGAVRGRERPFSAAPSSALHARGIPLSCADAIGTLRAAAVAIEPREPREPAVGEPGKPPQPPLHPRESGALERQRSDSGRHTCARPASASAASCRASSATPAPAEVAAPRSAPPLAPSQVADSSPPPPAPLARLLPSAPPPGLAEPIAIHVCDEPRGVRQDFHCELSLLLKHMRYFETYLAGVSRADELDISVHCDVHVFAWLMEYVRRVGHARVSEHGSRRLDGPFLEISNCVSILISSEFLQMGPLVDECERFVARHASQIAQLPIDLSCITPTTIERMAAHFTPAMLQGLTDRKGKLAPRLYDAALARLLDGQARALMRCVHCARLFTAEQSEWEPCLHAQPTVDWHGALDARHEAQRGWHSRAWVASLRAPPVSLSAMEAYWRLWGRLHSLECETCGSPFVAAELACCAYHPRHALPDASLAGACHPCCGQRALPLGVMRGLPNGCCVRDHTIRAIGHVAPQRLAPADGVDLDGAARAGDGSSRGQAGAATVAALVVAMRSLVTAGVSTMADGVARADDEAGGGAGRGDAAAYACVSPTAPAVLLARALQNGSALHRSATDARAHRPDGGALLGAASAAGARAHVRPLSACGKQGSSGASGGARIGAPGSCAQPASLSVHARTPTNAHAARAAVGRAAGRRARDTHDGTDDELEGAGPGRDGGVSDTSDSSASSDSDAPPPAGARRGAVGARGGPGVAAIATARIERPARSRRRPLTASAQREPVMSPRRARELKLDQQRVDDRRRVDRLVRALDLERDAQIGDGGPHGAAERAYAGGCRAVARGAAAHGWVRDDAHLLEPKPTFLRPSVIMHVSRGSSHTNGGVVMARPGSLKPRS